MASWWEHSVLTGSIGVDLTCLKRPDVTIYVISPPLRLLISSSIPDLLECSCGNIWV